MLDFRFGAACAAKCRVDPSVAFADAMPGSLILVMLSQIFGYFVAEGILDVYTTGIDTILICYGLDKEHNEASGNTKAGKSLKKFIKHNKKKKASGEDDDDDDDGDDMGGDDGGSSSSASAVQVAPAAVVSI